MLDRYRSGKYPKHERFSDEFFNTQGDLMEAMSRVAEMRGERDGSAASCARASTRRARRCGKSFRKGMVGSFADRKKNRHKRGEREHERNSGSAAQRQPAGQRQYRARAARDGKGLCPERRADGDGAARESGDPAAATPAARARSWDGACLDDAVNELAPKLEAADGLVVASPVYYASANATLIACLTACFTPRP